MADVWAQMPALSLFLHGQHGGNIGLIAIGKDLFKAVVYHNLRIFPLQAVGSTKLAAYPETSYLNSKPQREKCNTLSNLKGGLFNG